MNETDNHGIETYPKETQDSIVRGLSQTDTNSRGSFAQHADETDEGENGNQGTDK